jgi:hypothetical protein
MIYFLLIRIKLTWKNLQVFTQKFTINSKYLHKSIYLLMKLVFWSSKACDNKIRLFLDFKGPRLQKEMETSALALKGTVTQDLGSIFNFCRVPTSKRREFYYFVRLNFYYTRLFFWNGDRTRDWFLWSAACLSPPVIILRGATKGEDHEIRRWKQSLYSRQLLFTFWWYFDNLDY